MKSNKQKYVDYVRKTKRSYYKMFYTRPELRTEKRLNLLRVKPNAPESVRKCLYDVPKKYQHRLKKQKKSVQPNQSNMSVNTAIWENDIRNPQPSTSKRATQFMRKSCTNEARKRLALSLLNERRSYNAEAENNMPVSLEKFKRHTKTDVVIDNIIDVATDGDTRMFEKLKADPIIRERVLRNYYYAYYDSPEVIRSHYPLSFKACPAQVQHVVEQMPISPEIISIEDINDKTNEESSCTRDSVATGITVVAKSPKITEAKYSSHGEEEEKEEKKKQDDMPISFDDFQAHTNLEQVTLVYIERKYANKCEKVMQKQGFLHKIKTFIYNMFYTRPDLRTDKTLRLLRLSDTAPIKVRNKFYDIPKAYQQREKKPKKKAHEKCAEVVEESAAVCTSLADVHSHDDLNKILNVEQQTLALWLVNNTHKYSVEDERKIPISLEKFSKCTRIDEIIDEIIQDATEGNTEKLECLKSDKDVRKRVLYNYYYGFYLSPAIVRLHYPIRFKACPFFMKAKIEKIPNMTEENNNKEVFEETKTCAMKVSEAMLDEANSKPAKVIIISEEKLNLETSSCAMKVPEAMLDEANSKPAKVIIISEEKLNETTTSCAMEVTKEKLQAAYIETSMLKNISDVNMEKSTEKQIHENLPETPINTDRLELNTCNDISEDLNRLFMHRPPANDSCQMSTKYTRFISDEEIDQDIDEIMRSIHQSPNTDLEQLDSNKRAAPDSPIGFQPKRTKMHNLSATVAAEADDIAEDVSSLDSSEELIVNINNAVEFPLKMFTPVVAHTFSRPVVDLKQIEENLPISCERFKGNIDTTSVLNLLCKTIANGNQRLFQNMREDAKMCDTLLSNFYIQFFINQYMALFFPIKETENDMLSSFRSELGEALELTKTKQLMQENESLTEKQKHDEVIESEIKKSNIISSTECTQNNEVIENESQKLNIISSTEITENNEVIENESQKSNIISSTASTQNDKETENESEKMVLRYGTGTSSEGTQIEENNNENAVASTKVRNFYELYSTQYSKDLLTQFIKSKVLPEFEAEVLQKLENFLPTQNDPLSPKTNVQPKPTIKKEEKSKSRSAGEVYFDKWHRRHSLDYMFSNSVGEKRQLWNAILGMTFKEFKQYTHITQGSHIYQHAALIARCYSYTILERNTWPSNLFFSLENLIDYLKLKNAMLLKNFTLEHISPKLINYKDLFRATNFYECTAEYFQKRVEDFDSKEMQKKAQECYIKCWLTNSWKTRIPTITDENLINKISGKDKTSPTSQTRQSQNATQNKHTLIAENALKPTETKRSSTPQIITAENTKAPVSNVRKDTTEHKKKTKLIYAATKNQVKSPVKANVSAQIFTAIPSSGSSEENPSFVGITCSTQKPTVTPSPNLFSSSSGTGSAQLSENAVTPSIENDIVTVSQPLSEAGFDYAQVLAEHSYYFENTEQQQLNSSIQATSAEYVVQDPLSTEALLNLLAAQSIDSKKNADLLPLDEIKLEKQLPDKMIITLSDNGTVINVERVGDEVINIDEDDQNIENLLALSESPQDVAKNITLQSSDEHVSIRQTQPFFEPSQATATSSKNALVSSNVTIRKKSNKNPAQNKNNANADFGPQLTHVFRALPVQPVVRKNAVATANGKLPKPTNQSATYSMSQDLSLFNSSQVLKAVLQGTEKTTAAAAKKLTSNIPVRAKVVIEKKSNVKSKQVNNKQPLTVAETSTNELLLYHKIKKFDYFAELTTTQVVDFELSVIPHGQAYMRALICTGNAKFWLQSDNLESIFSFFRQDIITSIRNLLQEFKEFHYDEREKATDRAIDDAVQKICHQALCHLFSTAIPISACQLQLSNSLGDYNRALVRIKRFSGVPTAKLSIEKVFSAEFMEKVKNRLDQSVILIN